MSMPTPEDLIKAGVHIGHEKSKWNPKMSPFVFGVRNNFHIIDVFKTTERLAQAVEFLKEVISSGNQIIFLGVKVQTRSIVLSTAKDLKMPYVIGRWIGGLLTNFKVIKERIDHFKELEDKSSSGKAEGYTKKEKIQHERKLKKLEEAFGGLKDFNRLPGALFVSDVGREKTAVLEAKKMNIPIVAIVDTNGDPTQIDYPIPANDSSSTSLSLIYGVIRDELIGVKPQLQKVEPDKAEPVKVEATKNDKSN